MVRLIKILLITFFLWTVDSGLWTIRAEIPKLINYQARLTDKSGQPLEGVKAVTFRIYDAEAGGNLLWEETQNVNMQSGIFNVMLGGVTNLNIAFDKPYFLEIKVESEVMSPRQRIASVGYAMRAEKADYAVNAETVNQAKVKATASDSTSAYLDGKVDNVTLEVGDNKLKIKDEGISLSKLSSTAKDAIIKAWVNFDGTTGNIRDSYNVSSITKNGSGDYTVFWDKDFANTNYVVVCLCTNDSTQSNLYATGPVQGGISPGSFRFQTRNNGAEKINGNYVMVMAMGDQ